MCAFLSCHAVTFRLQNPYFPPFPWLQDHDEYITCLSHTGFSTSDWKGELSPGHGIVMKAAAECVQMLDLLILQALKPNNNKKVGALLSEGICYLKPTHF